MSDSYLNQFIQKSNLTWRQPKGQYKIGRWAPGDATRERKEKSLFAPKMDKWRKSWNSHVWTVILPSLQVLWQCRITGQDNGNMSTGKECIRPWKWVSCNGRECDWRRKTWKFGFSQRFGRQQLARSMKDCSESIPRQLWPYILQDKCNTFLGKAPIESFDMAIGRRKAISLFAFRLGFSSGGNGPFMCFHFPQKSVPVRHSPKHKSLFVLSEFFTFFCRSVVNFAKWLNRFGSAVVGFPCLTIQFAFILADKHHGKNPWNGHPRLLPCASPFLTVGRASTSSPPISRHWMERFSRSWGRRMA